MFPDPFPYRFIAVEGNIGSGKTTLCHKLADRYGCDLVLEQFAVNPFLPFFYENPERYAFPVELFFMTERHKQLLEHFAQPDLFRTFTVADYFFVKTLLFAKTNLSEAEFRLFNRLFSVLNATFPKPDLLLYLSLPVEMLMPQNQKPVMVITFFGMKLPPKALYKVLISDMLRFVKQFERNVRNLLAIEWVK